LSEAASKRRLVDRLYYRAAGQVMRAWGRTGARAAAGLYHRDLIHRTNNFETIRWMGVPIWQNVLDVWTIQETLFEVKPALLIEVGTHKGGSALMYAQLLDLIGAGTVLTVDIINIHELKHPRVTFHHGSSIAPETIEAVAKAVDEASGPVMVILDGNHDRDHVAQELELYSSFVTPGSYLLSQDGVIDRVGFFRDTRPGPLPANRAFLDNHPEFEYDRDRNERFRLTHHPLGWMRRRS
jgi:cephalosporin hydroxylase